MFGVSRREGHDASAFYRRFAAPEVSDADTITLPACTDRLWVGDARDMDAHGEVHDNSVALVVTSPPYFAGKEYEQTLGRGHVPGTYISYLEMLEEVFAECKRKLEPGGRIAVNVANLGRRPYRSLSADVITILQDRLGLLLRGEVIWQKAKGAAGNCAWGSFQRPGNPVLRDLTERVVIASKGRFDRAVPAVERDAQGLPSYGSAHVDEFMEATTDVWEIPPASATRVGHPAPFPVELPQRLIELYTYREDLVLDPFMGAGTTAVAAVRTGRHYVGFDTDASYIATAEKRVAAERLRLEANAAVRYERVMVPPSASRNGQQRLNIDPADARSVSQSGDSQVGGSRSGGSQAGGSRSGGARSDGSRVGGSQNGEDAGSVSATAFQARSSQQGRKAQMMAMELLAECGFTEINDKVRRTHGIQPNLEALDQQGDRWLFDVSGAFSVTQRPGLRRTDTLWKALGKAAVMHAADPATRLILLTTNRPASNSSGHHALEALTGPDKPVRAVINMLCPDDRAHLTTLAHGAETG